MQKQSPVIKNYILSSEVIVLDDKNDVNVKNIIKKLYTNVILFPALRAGG